MITKEDIQNLANLARIQIEPSEAESLTGEIDNILGYIGQIENMKAEDFTPSYPVKNVLRKDEVTNKPGEFTEEILNNAPSREGQYLKVKKILQ
ncbi:MAG: Asp-tRNA(Asn)/Glu-tRNA(Gln) amidotransferase subunit GatC [Parcubacteria group bacterium]